MKKFKVLLITDYIPTGGSRTYLAGMLEQLSKNGGAVIIFTRFEIDSVIKHKLDQIDSLIIPLNKNRYASIPSRIRHLLSCFFKKQNILITCDIILTDFIFNLISLSPFSALKIVSPISYQLHGIDYKEKESEKVLLNKTSVFKNLKSISRIYVERKILNSIPKNILVFSKYAQSLLEREMIGTKSKVVNPGIGFVDKVVCKISGNTARDSLIISSRIDPRKGVTAFFTNIFPLISEDQLATTDVIVMSNFHKNSHLDAFFESISNKVCDNVQLLHNPSEKKRFLVMKNASLVVLPSLDLETYGFSAQEALLSGIPVVAYNRCAYSEFVPKEMLVANEIEFAKKIEEIIRHPLIYRRLALKARHRLKNENTWSKYYDTILDQT